MDTIDKTIQRLVVQVQEETILLGKVIDRLGTPSLCKPVTLTREQLEALRAGTTSITDQTNV